MSEPAWRFGVAPLAQTTELASLMRTVAGLALALEEEDPAAERLIGQLRRAELDLRDRAPLDLAPRLGGAAGAEQRVYIDHSHDIGAFNPCFPEYRIEVDGDRASGTVTFPLVYEGPPGLVHGGFLGVFFDCVIQDHNCELGQAGKTASLEIVYERPTPLLTGLDFEVRRAVSGRRITSTAGLFLEGQRLCRATMEAAVGDRSRLPAVHPRRDRG